MKPILISITLLLAVVLLLQVGVGYSVPRGAVVILYLVIYVVVSRAMRPRRDPSEVEEVPDFDWPTSGPVGRLGQPGLVVTFTVSGVLAMLNPFQLVQVVRQGIGNAALRKRAEEVGDDPPVPERLHRLPFEGEWLVYNGGTTPATSHSWDVLTQRYAYDFVIVDEAFRRHTGRGTSLVEYHCYDRDIVATASGRVVVSVDGHRDAPLVGLGMVDVFATSFIGNHVVIRHGEEEFGFYAHLVPGSVAVRVGDRVEAGQLLGRCGHSGHSSEPHLHFHLQDGPDFFTALGRPIEFGPVTIDGERRERAILRVGDRAANAEPAPSDPGGLEEVEDTGRSSG